jgi:hypothetical protein
MPFCRFALSASLLPLVLSAGAIAQDRQEGTVTPAEAVAAAGDCVAGQAAAGQPAADCVNRAQELCLQFPESAADAATACFRDMKDAWGTAVAARMDEIAATAPEEIAAVARIEVRYDLTINLLQCDRMDALNRLRDQPPELLRAQDARCESTATGLTYVKLLLQSRDAE